MIIYGLSRLVVVLCSRRDLNPGLDHLSCLKIYLACPICAFPNAVGPRRNVRMHLRRTSEE